MESESSLDSSCEQPGMKTTAFLHIPGYEPEWTRRVSVKNGASQSTAAHDSNSKFRSRSPLHKVGWQPPCKRCLPLPQSPQPAAYCFDHSAASSAFRASSAEIVASS